MCFIALLYRVVPEYPVVLAANRDEALNRQGTPPRQLMPGLWGGNDPNAGGTWLGVNGQRRIVAVANRRSQTPLDPNARSRGLLCLDCLREPQPGRIQSMLEEQTNKHSYNPFNLLVADPTTAWTASYTQPDLQLTELEPGLHVVGNTLPDNRADPKVARGMALISRPDDIAHAFPMLKDVCRDHGTSPNDANAICVHGPQYGTLSTTLVAAHEFDIQSSRLQHAQGSPCSSEFGEYSHLFRART